MMRGGRAPEVTTVQRIRFESSSPLLRRHHVSPRVRTRAAVEDLTTDEGTGWADVDDLFVFLSSLGPVSVTCMEKAPALTRHNKAQGESATWPLLGRRPGRQSVKAAKAVEPGL